MNKRVIAIVAAAVLAVLGVAVLGAWAKQADARAYDGATMVSVLQVTQEVPASTPVTQLATSTRLVKLPASAVPDGALKDLTSVTGEVTTTALEPGEVLLRARVADPDEKPAETSSVPKGLQELSITLDPQRLVDGQLKVGDTVGVVASYADTSTTKLLANRVKVTRFGTTKSGESGGGSTTITLALSREQIESVANAAEFGKVWLTKQNSVSETKAGDPVTSKGNVR